MNDIFDVWCEETHTFRNLHAEGIVNRTRERTALSGARLLLLITPMVKIQARRSVGRAVEYFLTDPGLSRAEKTGRWVGSGAISLGLDSEESQIIEAGRVVEEADFRAVLSGYGPPTSSTGQDGRPLNGRYVPKARRCAWDVVISAHKSVSVAGLCLPSVHGPSDLVRTAFAQAIRDAFVFVETLAHRANGRRPDVHTGSLVAASFLHRASRRNDPHMHQHIVMMNATRDTSGSRREWYSLEPIRIYRHIRAIDMIFQRQLHLHLRAAGLDARMATINGIPVAVLPAVPSMICRRTSQAHQAILDAVATRWTRQDRSQGQKRLENIINDRLRPEKIALTGQGDERFQNVLTASETASVAAKILIPGTSAEILQPRAELDQTAIAAACQKAIATVGTSLSSSRDQTVAAWLASLSYLEHPFAIFHQFLAHNIGRILCPPNDPFTAEVYAEDQTRAWSENEAWFASQAATAKEARAAITPPDKASEHLGRPEIPAEKNAHRDYEKFPTPSDVQNLGEIHPESDRPPAKTQVEEYLSSSSPEDLEEQQLRLNP